MKTVVQVILVIAIAFLAYLLYDSIMKPIRFNKELDKRSKATIERLIDIRKAEVAYKSEYGRYTGSFDTLLNFVHTGMFSVVKAEGAYTDSMLNAGITEKKALKLGLIKRDTVKVAVKDSIFKALPDVNVLRYVPYAGDLEFELGAKVLLTGSKVKVPVFQANVHYKDLLHGLDKQLVINKIDERERIDKYPGIKVGDLEEPNNNAGNWE